jgi:hypothetical protein
MVPVRAVPVFAPYDHPTLPFPVPLPGPLIVIQDALLAEVHEQSD